MRQIQHFRSGPDKILHIEAEGCTINVIIGTHDPSGTDFTTIEVTPDEPDGEGRTWMAIGGPSVIVVPTVNQEAQSWVFRDIITQNHPS